MIFENVKEIEIKAVNERLSIEGWAEKWKLAIPGTARLKWRSSRAGRG